MSSPGEVKPVTGTDIEVVECADVTKDNNGKDDALSSAIFLLKTIGFCGSPESIDSYSIVEGPSFSHPNKDRVCARITASIVRYHPGD